jgi:RimJ/RimL family protein N-acetyltransferase
MEDISMELRGLRLDDLDFYERIHTDPEMWAELGGPRPREGIAEKLKRDVRLMEEDVHWVFVIVPDPSTGNPAGTVPLWEHEWNGEAINEIGWMVLPEFQGQGLAKAAVAETLGRARAEGRFDPVHAFPATTNGPSNGICRTLGFELIGEVEYESPSSTLTCNHWRYTV